MVFSSIVFLFTFLPVVLILYFLVPKAAKNVILLIASLIFYAWGEPVYVFLMLLSILLNYFCGLEIAEKAEEGSGARGVFLFTVLVNLGLLGFFKYAGFLVGSLNAVLPFDIPAPELNLPVGISFYTFQILSYIIDVYRKKVAVQKNLISFGLYVTMFPQLIAGPIVRYEDIETQLAERKVTLDKFGSGAAVFIQGLAKKVLLANLIGGLFSQVSAMPLGNISVLTAWLGCLAYTFQIYFDFSGYSDMAIGLGRMFGFRFPKNFDYPYISRSITEFWRRWHISLGTWFREYVYIPLGGNRVSRLKHIRNILAVWLLTGLWHGASWNFVVWGLYYGAILLVEKFLLGQWIERLPAVIQHLYSLFLIMTGWVFFFSPSLSSASGYLGAMFGSGGRPAVDSESLFLLLSNLLPMLILAVCATPVVRRLFGKAFEKKAWLQIAFQCCIYGLLLFLCIARLVTETYNPFLYFRF